MDLRCRITYPCSTFQTRDAPFSVLELVRPNLGSGETMEAYELYQNQPNPFSDITVIGFCLPMAGEAMLTITDAVGRVIQTLRGEYGQELNQVQLNASELHAGMLPYSLRSGDFIATCRMICTE